MAAHNLTIADAGIIGLALIAQAFAPENSQARLDLAAEIAHQVQPEGCTCQDASICRWCSAYRQYRSEP